jgi:predicted N-acetyltransferase YhbS
MTDAILDEIEPLQARHNVLTFSCGQQALDTWLRTRALRNQDSGDSRTFVLTEADRVIGFYALTTASVARVSLPGSLRRNAPDPVPLMLLGQLAVDASHTGRGLGRLLLRDAMLRVANLAQHVGFRGLATHPLDSDAERFYRPFGFTSVPDAQPNLMVLPTQRLLAAVEASRQ